MEEEAVEKELSELERKVKIMVQQNLMTSECLDHLAKIDADVKAALVVKVDNKVLKGRITSLENDIGKEKLDNKQIRQANTNLGKLNDNLKALLTEKKNEFSAFRLQQDEVASKAHGDFDKLKTECEVAKRDLKKREESLRSERKNSEKLRKQVQDLEKQNGPSINMHNSLAPSFLSQPSTPEQKRKRPILDTSSDASHTVSPSLSAKSATQPTPSSQSTARRLSYAQASPIHAPSLRSVSTGLMLQRPSAPGRLASESTGASGGAVWQSSTNGGIFPPRVRGPYPARFTDINDPELNRLLALNQMTVELVPEGYHLVSQHLRKNPTNGVEFQDGPIIDGNNGNNEDS